jgi:ABC-type transport system substrate-binding protein
VERFISTRSAWKLLLPPFFLAGCAGTVGPIVETQLVEQVVTQQVRVEVPAEPFSTPHPILSDVRVRQAIAYCTDKAALVATSYPWMPAETAASLVMDSFVPRVHWAYPLDGSLKLYAYDPERGADLLEAAGWNLAEGAEFRQNAAGEELALKLTTTTSALREAWAAVWEQQLADCGVRLVRLHAPASWVFGDTTGLARRDFEIAAFAWVSGPDPGGLPLYRCEAIPSPNNDWSGQNYMGWCNPQADEAIERANAFLEFDRLAPYRAFQSAFTEDAVSLPLFSRPEVFAYRPDLEGVRLAEGEPLYTWNAAEWEIPGKDEIVIGFSAEPASLFDITENSFVAQLVTALTDGVRYTSEVYDFQPRVQAELSTMESGLATGNVVTVGGGDRVVTASGEVAEVGEGVTVWNADWGRESYVGQPIDVRQLTVRYQFVEGLTWSDGVPVGQEDFEVYHRAACGLEGSRLAATCDRVEAIEFQPDGYTIRWLPGYQSSSYMLAPFGFYPAHQELELGNLGLGGLLADEPVERWEEHPEICLGQRVVAGPYRVVEWEFGRQIALEANPFYDFPGAYLHRPPWTPKITLRFVERDQAAALLLAGEIDFLGWDTLGENPDESLVAAADAGLIALPVFPTATWEHVDMNLFVP